MKSEYQGRDGRNDLVHALIKGQFRILVSAQNYFTRCTGAKLKQNDLIKEPVTCIVCLAYDESDDES